MTFIEKRLKNRDTETFIPTQQVELTDKSDGHKTIKTKYPLVRIIFIDAERNVYKVIVENEDVLQGIFKDHATNKCAVVSDTTMQAFRIYMERDNGKVMILKAPYSHFKDHQKVRVLEGEFAGHEGRIVRIRRRRKLVLEVGNFAVAMLDFDPSKLELID